MNESMIVALEIRGNSAVFQYPEGHREPERALDDLLDRWDAGRLDHPHYLDELSALVARYPKFIDGHAHLGFALLEQDKPKRALDSCLRGLTLGEAAIPHDFDGAIEWAWLENRPFLRAAHGAVCCYLQLRHGRKALALMEKMLAWNPEDNQGMRHLVGSAYLRAGDVDKARTVLEAEAAHFPPYRYELALLLLSERKHRAAATSLRLGFVENGYIAEILCGTPDPLPLAIWRGSAFAGLELAHEYASAYGDLWHRTPKAVAFLRWLHTHPKVMNERAAVLEWREALFWERDIVRRRGIGDKLEAAVRRVDDRLSEEIVVERTDRHGRRIFPWLHSDMQRSTA